MATFQVTIRKSAGARRDGMRRVYIRVTHKRKVRYVATEMYVADSDVKRDGSIRDYDVMEVAEEIVRRWRKESNLLGRQLDTMDVGELVRYLQQEKKGEEAEQWDLDIMRYADRDAEMLAARGQTGTAGLRRTMVNSLREYVGKDGLSVFEIKAKLLNGWVEWLRRKPAIGGRNKGDRAASLYIAQLRAVYNKAKREYNDEDAGEVRIPYNPFGRMEKLHTAATRPRAITAKQLIAIASLADEPNNNGTKSRFDLARDVFVLSFLLVGINSVDLFNCGKVKDGRLEYERSKTRTRRADRAAISIKIEPEAEALIAKYADNSKDVHGFIFHRLYATAANFNAAINYGLKEVGKRVGLEGLQFYAARHTWATLAVNEVGINKYIVHQALNHVDERTAITDIYIKKSWKPIDEANRKVLDYVFAE